MIGDFIIKMCNVLIKGVGAVLSGLVSILPNSPFVALSNSAISKYLPTLNYFIPVNEIISIGETWLVAIGVYYIYQAVLRWTKAIV